MKFRVPTSLLGSKGKAAKVKSVQADRARWPAEVLQVVNFRGLPDAELSNRTSIPSGPGKQTCSPGHGQQATGFLSQSSLAPKALGLTIAPSLLARADQVIEQ